jgi:cation transport regulator ChaB
MPCGDRLQTSTVAALEDGYRGFMPRDRRNEELPGTLRRSPAKAQRLYTEVHDSAVESYGEGERAHRTAMDALKHSFEKVGDHWEPKRTKGPSDAQAAKRGPAARRSTTPTAGGVDVFGHTREELYERAKRLGVKGRSSMTKQELGEAIARKQD